MVSRIEKRGTLPWAPIGVLSLSTGLLGLWLVLHPASPARVALVDNLASFVLPTPMLIVCFGPYLWSRYRRRSGATRADYSGGVVRWAPILIASSVVADTIAQGIWTYYAQVLHQPTPFPSLDDVANLSYYPHRGC